MHMRRESLCVHVFAHVCEKERESECACACMHGGVGESVCVRMCMHALCRFMHMDVYAHMHTHLTMIYPNTHSTLKFFEQTFKLHIPIF